MVTSESLAVKEVSGSLHLAELLATHPELNDLNVAPVLLDVPVAVGAIEAKHVHGLAKTVHRSIRHEVLDVSDPAHHVFRNQRLSIGLVPAVPDHGRLVAENSANVDVACNTADDACYCVVLFERTVVVCTGGYKFIQSLIEVHHGPGQECAAHHLAERNKLVEGLGIPARTVSPVPGRDTDILKPDIAILVRRHARFLIGAALGHARQIGRYINKGKIIWII